MIYMTQTEFEQLECKMAGGSQVEITVGVQLSELFLGSQQLCRKVLL